jgi:hypothetical protein
MNDLDTELELAVAELAFWLDFAKWWRTRHDSSEDPRIIEVLEHAERRYAEAEASCQKAPPYESEGHRRRPILMEVK